MKKKYVQLSDVIYALSTGIILAEIHPNTLKRIHTIESIDIDEPQEISINKAKKFADYYRNDVLNRDNKSIDEHFTIFMNSIN